MGSNYNLEIGYQTRGRSCFGAFLYVQILLDWILGYFPETLAVLEDLQKLRWAVLLLTTVRAFSS